MYISRPRGLDKKLPTKVMQSVRQKQIAHQNDRHRRSRCDPFGSKSSRDKNITKLGQLPPNEFIRVDWQKQSAHQNDRHRRSRRESFGLTTLRDTNTRERTQNPYCKIAFGNI